MIFSSADVTADCKAYVAAGDKFKEHYGYEFDGICVVGFKDYYEIAAFDIEMARDADLLSSWDCWLFVDEKCTFDEYLAACEDGTVGKYFR